MNSAKVALCVLILMRLKTELNPFGNLRLHKSALLLDVFSGKDCFEIEDVERVLYSSVDSLVSEVKNLQSQYDADTEATLKHQLDSIDTRIIESYKRSIPYILQSASFVNTIADNGILTLVSVIIGILKETQHADFQSIVNFVNNCRFADYSFSRKDILSAMLNLEKSGVLVKGDADYRLADNMRDVSEYVRLL